MTLRNVRPALESEVTLLGGLILDNELFPAIKGKIFPSDFGSERNKIIFKAMCDLYEKHKSFDIPMLVDFINFSDSRDTLYLYDLPAKCCSTKNLNSHADIIREKSVQRQLIEIAEEIKSADLRPSIEDEMADDFSKYTYVIQPSFTHDHINLILVCMDNETNINTNALIDPLELLSGSVGYLFGLMNQLTIILKTK